MQKNQNGAGSGGHSEELELVVSSHSCGSTIKSYKTPEKMEQRRPCVVNLNPTHRGGRQGTHTCRHLLRLRLRAQRAGRREAAVRETADDPGLFKKHLTSSLYSTVPHFPMREEPEMSVNTREACTQHRHTAQNQRKGRGLADKRACSKTDNLNVGLETHL